MGEAGGVHPLSMPRACGGAESWSAVQSTLAVLEDLVHVRAPTWQLTVTCDFTSRESMQVNPHSYKIKINLEKKCAVPVTSVAAV